MTFCYRIDFSDELTKTYHFTDNTFKIAIAENHRSNSCLNGCLLLANYKRQQFEGPETAPLKQSIAIFNNCK